MAAPDGEYRWDWLDERLLRLRDLGLTPIAGLLHHGSGPRSTSLLDPLFPEKFALYAGHFAERYPWIEDYTPINEPLTTARFSCLYGIWYPHARDDRAFVRAMVNQTRATILAMRAIRAVNPRARLIQTEDMGRCQSTPPLEYQRDFENARRWLSLDLLQGRIDPLLAPYLEAHGLTGAEIGWLRENAVAPDVVGLNHYLLSNRFLDHRLELYPEHFHGGNGRDRYADVGAVDTPHAPLVEPASIFMEAWERYRLPVAATEVHVRGHRESQMRWLKEIWQSALEARAQGAEFVAVTAWSLLGTYDWDSLCTQSNMFYEPGVFDLRGGHPRPTALAKLVRTLASEGNVQHPVFENTKPILITVDNEAMGRAVSRVFEERKMNFRLITGAEMDLKCPVAVQGMFASYDPWAIVATGTDAPGFTQACADRRLPLISVARECSEEQLPHEIHSGLDRLLDDLYEGVAQ
jgi:dTDP-4-dehydrorhamnose reductase